MPVLVDFCHATTACGDRQRLHPYTITVNQASQMHIVSIEQQSRFCAVCGLMSRMCAGPGLHSATSTANKSTLGTPTLASVAAAAAAAKTEEADWRQRIISVRRLLMCHNPLSDMTLFHTQQSHASTSSCDTQWMLVWVPSHDCKSGSYTVTIDGAAGQPRVEA